MDDTDWRIGRGWKGTQFHEMQVSSTSASDDGESSSPSSAPEEKDLYEKVTANFGFSKPSISLQQSSEMDSSIENVFALGVLRVVADAQCPDLSRIFNLKDLSTDKGFSVLCSKVIYLKDLGFIKTQVIQNETQRKHISVRIYAMIDGITQSRNSMVAAHASRDFKEIMPLLDKSESSWAGDWNPAEKIESYFSSQEDEPDSLFYIFNTLEPPAPSIQDLSSINAIRAVEDVFENDISGLTTPLYPYQQRSAAMMIQREMSPKDSPDPRFECLHGPTGQTFYYDIIMGNIVLEPLMFKEPTGGLLCETMGYGKTLICLAVILATKGHCSCVPDGERMNPPPSSGKMRTLADICVQKAISESIPWKTHFYSLARRDFHHENLVTQLQSGYSTYTKDNATIMNAPRRWTLARHFTDGLAIKLCSTTLISVPPNLLKQWQQEIEKHTESGALDVIVFDNSCEVIPSSDILARYDIILISSTRLNKEYLSDLHDPRDCVSPLVAIRWLRIIVDEGVGFLGQSFHTNSLAMLDKMHFDGRWIVSGAPSSSLRGVEINLAANVLSSSEDDREGQVHKTLEERKAKNPLDREKADLDKIKTVVMKFLRMQPWVRGPYSESTEWSKYLAPSRIAQLNSATVLRSLLQSVMIRHRIQDVELDLMLPPLSSTVTHLKPRYYDKLITNLFNVQLTVNSVASERTDQDYMFHAVNRPALNLLLNNSRHSTFHWVGVKKQELEATLKEGRSYLKESSKNVSNEDRELLTSALEAGDEAINDEGWLMFSSTNDIGAWVADLPEEMCETWNMAGPPSPMLLGMSQTKALQKHIKQHEREEDPSIGLAGAGLRALQDAQLQTTREVWRNSTKKGNKPKTLPRDLDSSKKTLHPFNVYQPANLPKTSPLSKPSIIGFSSSKLSYLVSQILLHLHDSKFLIFYSHPNTAFWIGEALELVFITCYRIYAGTLSQKLRSEYLSLFDREDSVRILLMDIRHASHGLHIAAANRIYITDPIWQPHIEAQAIKRAHRIGQTRPVHVETLVLRGTLEEKMLQRRREMSNGELRSAEKSLMDDKSMEEIVKEHSKQFFKFTDEETKELGARVAWLDDGMTRKLFVETQTAGDQDASKDASIKTDDSKRTVNSAEEPLPKRQKKVQFGSPSAE